MFLLFRCYEAEFGVKHESLTMETRSPSEIGKRHRREVDVAIGKSIILVEGAEEGGELNGKLL